VTIDLVLVGFGNVAKRFVTLLAERDATLRRDYGAAVRIVGIATKRHGQIFSTRGVDPGAFATASAPRETNRPLTSVEFIRRATRASRAAARQGRLVVVETTTLDIRRGEPAIAHVRTALAGGAHVVTANKGPAAFAHRALARAATQAGRRFLFEGAVMDGIPIFNLVRETLTAVNVAGFRGIVNSTTNFILTGMEQGQSFESALLEMQARGIAEADPSLDVDGWDAAAKTAAMANVFLGAAITPQDVQREGVTPAAAARAQTARASGRRLKLVASAAREGRRVRARVALEELEASDLLAGVEGQQNAVILRTDLLDEIAIVQQGGGLTHTAYALLSDLLTIVRGASRRPPRAAPRGRSL
jgi:homoserine dehydrogenase